MVWCWCKGWESHKRVHAFFSELSLCPCFMNDTCDLESLHTVCVHQTPEYLSHGEISFLWLFSETGEHVEFSGGPMVLRSAPNPGKRNSLHRVFTAGAQCSTKELKVVYPPTPLVSCWPRLGWAPPDQFDPGSRTAERQTHGTLFFRHITWCQTDCGWNLPLFPEISATYIYASISVHTGNFVQWNYWLSLCAARYQQLEKHRLLNACYFEKHHTSPIFGFSIETCASQSEISSIQEWYEKLSIDKSAVNECTPIKNSSETFYICWSVFEKHWHHEDFTFLPCTALCFCSLL